MDLRNMGHHGRTAAENIFVWQANSDGIYSEWDMTLSDNEEWPSGFQDTVVWSGLVWSNSIKQRRLHRMLGENLLSKKFKALKVMFYNKFISAAAESLNQA